MVLSNHCSVSVKSLFCVCQIIVSCLRNTGNCLSLTFVLFCSLLASVAQKNYDCAIIANMNYFSVNMNCRIVKLQYFSKNR